MRDLVSGPTKCLLTQPGFSTNSFYNMSDVARFVGARYSASPLGLATVAALLPHHWEFRLADEAVRPLSDADIEWADIVLVSGMLPQQHGILTTIERAHGRGKPVAVGGPDPTSQAQLYAAADFLVLGEGEVTIPAFIEDLGRGITSGLYQSDRRANMAEAVIPRFDLIRFADYMRVGVQWSRGCPYNCEFCDIVELFGRQPRTKTPEHVVAELQSLYDLGYRGHVDFVDDNFIGNKRAAAEVLRTIRDWSAHHGYPFYFSTEASIDLANEAELLQLVQENDFRYVFFGIESPDEHVLEQTGKTQNRRVSVGDAVRTMTAHGIIVNGGFILGFDSETEHTADRMASLIEETGIATAMVGTLAALPNTRLSQRLSREGRLFAGGRMTVDPSVDIDQTTSALNFATARPRTAILQDQARVYRRIYAPASYYRRVLHTATHLRPNHRHHPALLQSLRLLWAFVQVSARAGFNRHSGLLYWRTLVSVLIRNPQAVVTVVSMAALYVHFAGQAEYVIRTIEDEVTAIEAVGEERFNKLMMDGARLEHTLVAGGSGD